MTTITGLPIATTVNDVDAYVISQGGTSKQVPFSLMKTTITNLFGTGITIPSTQVTGLAVVATSGAFSDLAAKPTTIAGYGITDAITLSGAQTLTNKTLTAPVITGGTIGQTTPGPGSFTTFGAESLIPVLTTGTLTAYVVALAPTLTVAPPYLVFSVVFHATSGASPTINFGAGAKPIMVRGTGGLAAPTTGSIKIGQTVMMAYDGTNCVILDQQFAINGDTTSVGIPVDPVFVAAAIQTPNMATAVATTSGTAVDFTGIPSWAKRVSIMLNQVSTNGTSGLIVQIGNGAIVATGYVGSASNPGATLYNSTGFGINAGSVAASTYSGLITLQSMGSNIWVEGGNIGLNSGSGGVTSGGVKSLAGVLDRVRITTIIGTDLFDLGSVNIMWE